MSLFSSLKNDQPTYSDKVWKDNEFAIKGMITDALQAITKNEMAVVFTFFADKGQTVIDFLTTKQVPYFGIDSASAQDAASQSQVVFLVDANLLSSESQVLTFLMRQSKKQKVNSMFFGHHPIPSKENMILKKLATVDGDITFYSSLDDPAFEIFGGVQLKSTLEKLGLADEEAIEHTMVTKAMKNARKKIEQSVRQEITCTTESEWFSKNYKK